MIKNVVLTGMMGVGKTTIGKNLAEKLSFSFLDTDKIIEEEEGSSIKDIFKKRSESYFRKIEQKTTLRLLKNDNSVIALGGGAFLNNIIRETSKKNSISFWLDVNVEVLIKRLEKTRKRPLLLKKNLRQTVNKIYLERKKTYSEADFRINCGNLKTEEITLKILSLYEKTGNKI